VGAQTSGNGCVSTLKVNARAISAFADQQFLVFVTDLLPFLSITLALATATLVELHRTATKSLCSSYFYSIYLLISFAMSPSVLKPLWPLTKFSFKRTPALIKRDIVCLFSSKARGEKRTEEERQRARLQMKQCAQPITSSTAPAQEQVPQTPVRLSIVPTSSHEATEPHSASKDTTATFPTFDTDSSPITPSSTAATEISFAKNLPTTYDGAMAYFEHWFKQQHPNGNIPRTERDMFRGVTIIITIALLQCFQEAAYSPLIGFRPDEFRVAHNPCVLERVLASLTDDRRDAHQLAENLLSLAGCDSLDYDCPREFLRRIGFAKTRISDAESYLLHDRFQRLLGHDLEFY
jgi:hypothetical protein